MTNWEAKMLEKFSEAVEDAITRYLSDSNMTDMALEEYFGDYTIIEKVKSYREVTGA